MERPRRWSQDEIDRLKRLARRHTVPELAQLFQRTTSALRTKAAQERIVLAESPRHSGSVRQRLPWEAKP